MPSSDTHIWTFYSDPRSRPATPQPQAHPSPAEYLARGKEAEARGDRPRATEAYRFAYGANRSEEAWQGLYRLGEIDDQALRTTDYDPLEASQLSREQWSPVPAPPPPPSRMSSRASLTESSFDTPPALELGSPGPGSMTSAAMPWTSDGWTSTTRLLSRTPSPLPSGPPRLPAAPRRRAEAGLPAPVQARSVKSLRRRATMLLRRAIHMLRILLRRFFHAR
jgi:hypothetical protein